MAIGCIHLLENTQVIVLRIGKQQETMAQLGLGLQCWEISKMQRLTISLGKTI